jgi:DNA repair exonuclease SbcCD ATPase subunit
MSERKMEIVGQEGLATTLAHLAGQLSALEKQTTTAHEALVRHLDEQIGLLREIYDNKIESVKTDIMTYRSTHQKVHDIDKESLEKAFKNNEKWMDSQNEWRAESRERMLTYPTKPEIDETINRVQSMVNRNATDIEKLEQQIEAKIERLTGLMTAEMSPLKTHMLVTTTSVSTIRALMVVVLFVITVVGFYIGLQTNR